MGVLQLSRRSSDKIVEVALTVAVILTATYGPDKYSSRAFRLLPWTADASHPDAGQASGSATASSGPAIRARYSSAIRFTADPLEIGPAAFAGAAIRVARLRSRHSAA
jgi:hypothetical protein